MRTSTFRLAIAGVALAGAAVTLPASAALASTTGQHDNGAQKAVPVVAVKSLGDCASGNVCVWVNGGFENKPHQYGAPGFTSLTADDHDTVSSWANKTGSTYCLYDNGSSITLDRLGAGGSRAVMPSGTNDRADAIGRC